MLQCAFYKIVRRFVMKKIVAIALCVAFVICGVSGNDKVSIESAKSAIKKARDDYSTALNGYFNASITFVALQKGLDDNVAKIAEVAKASQNGKIEAQKVSKIMQRIQNLEAELQEAQSAKNPTKKYLALKDKFVSLSDKSTNELIQSKATLEDGIAIFRKYAK